MRFEGFRIGEVSVCYGRSYYSDIHQVEYEGGICEGKRWGMGIHYDRMGTVLFEGEWLNDGNTFEKHIVVTEKNQQIHNYIEELIVSDNCCNGEEWTALDLCVLHKLKSIKIGDPLLQTRGTHPHHRFVCTALFHHRRALFHEQDGGPAT